MRIDDVFKSLVSGCVVYALVAACSSAGEPDKQAAGTDTGGAVGMNGNAGSDATGTGAVAMAATGGDTSETVCDCPALEPDVRIERDCNIDASVGTTKFAEITITGASLTDLVRVKAVWLGENMTAWPSGTTALANTLTYRGSSVAIACSTDSTAKAAFFVPADLADSVE